MIKIEIPGRTPLELHYLVSDVNGTLALDGVLINGIQEAIDSLRDKLEITLLTADTFGKGAMIAEELGVQIKVLTSGHEREQKSDFVTSLGANRVVSIGQGANDELMLKESALGICVLSDEGTAVSALMAADIITKDSITALDLLQHPTRLIATLRK